MGTLKKNGALLLEEQNNNFDQKVEEKIEEFREGDYVETPAASKHDMTEPPWLDKEKFYKAGKIYSEYFGGVNFSHLCGLLLSFYFSKNIDTLKSTKMSASIKNLYERYIGTVRHVQSWYEGDVWDVDSPSRKSLFIVRSMHARVAKAMNNLKNDGVVYVSQWDMTLTQWAFIGPLLLYPHKFGLQCCSKEDIDCLIHFWKAIGHLLGIQDKYNLCNGTYEEVLQTCKRVLNEYREKVIESDPSSVEMAYSVVTAFNKLDAILSWGFLVNFIHQVVNVPCLVKMGLLDTIYFRVMRFMMEVVNSYSYTRYLLNELLRWKIEKADKEVKTFEKLKINPNFKRSF